MANNDWMQTAIQIGSQIQQTRERKQQREDQAAAQLAQFIEKGGKVVDAKEGYDPVDPSVLKYFNLPEGKTLVPPEKQRGGTLKDYTLQELRQLIQTYQKEKEYSVYFPDTFVWDTNQESVYQALIQEQQKRLGISVPSQKQQQQAATTQPTQQPTQQTQPGLFQRVKTAIGGKFNKPEQTQQRPPLNTFFQ